MKRICNFILLLCLVQLAVAQNRIAEICWEIIQIKYWLYPTGLTGVMPRKTHCKVYRIALIWVSIWWRSI